jgi:hypothetical protein
MVEVVQAVQVLQQAFQDLQQLMLAVEVVVEMNQVILE